MQLILCLVSATPDLKEVTVHLRRYKVNFTGTIIAYGYVGTGRLKFTVNRSLQKHLIKLDFSDEKTNTSGESSVRGTRLQTLWLSLSNIAHPIQCSLQWK